RQRGRKKKNGFLSLRATCRFLWLRAFSLDNCRRWFRNSWSKPFIIVWLPPNRASLQKILDQVAPPLNKNKEQQTNEEEADDEKQEAKLRRLLRDEDEEELWWLAALMRRI